MHPIRYTIRRSKNDVRKEPYFIIRIAFFNGTRRRGRAWRVESISPQLRAPVPSCEKKKNKKKRGTLFAPFRESHAYMTRDKSD